MTRRLRLLKVIVQPIFVVDDGESLVEQAAQPVEVPASEWPTFITGRFAEGFEALRREVEGPHAARAE
jgi:hypothetical protein